MAGLLLNTGGRPASSLSWNLMDDAGLVLCDEKEDRRFSQPELVLDSLFSAVLLLTAVRGRSIDRRDLELSLDDGTSLIDSSRANIKSLGADHWRCECGGWTGSAAVPAASRGVGGCDTLRRGSEGTEGMAEDIGQLALEAPGHFRLPGRRMSGSTWSVPKARPAAAAATVPRAQSYDLCQHVSCSKPECVVCPVPWLCALSGPSLMPSRYSLGCTNFLFIGCVHFVADIGVGENGVGFSQAARSKEQNVVVVVCVARGSQRSDVVRVVNSSSEGMRWS